jgi:hypothetical protein
VPLEDSEAKLPKPPSQSQAKRSAAFILALEREHNAPVTPFLPRSIARIRKATYIGSEMIGSKQPTFRSKTRRK